MAAAAGCRSRRPFAVACGVLSRRVRPDSEAANTAASALAVASPRTMLLMPGADVTSDANNVASSPARAQLTVLYGGRVAVFDDVPEDRAEELVRVASAPAGGLPDMRVARKASLRRFMEKRRDRVAARAPYGACLPDALQLASNSKRGKATDEAQADAGSWLGLGIPGGSGR